MRVLVVENDRITALGQIETALLEAGAKIELCRPHAGEALPSDGLAYDALVVMGGPQSAIDDERHPYLPALCAMMRRYGDAGRSVLGVCLGSQLLARSYGATNLIGEAFEFGWCDIQPTQQGLADPLLASVGGAFPIFQWHSDTFTLPEGAIRLAHNQTATNQAFRIGRATYGTQFHFEVDRSVATWWRDLFPEQIERMEPGWIDGFDAIAAARGPAADAAGLAIARAWVSTIAAGMEAQGGVPVGSAA
ncbi:type 1 glutamine amidotransferase [Mycoplana rhizolycopersici]|uniref:Type 1 glutamine amidotransferase n=1 Tax=Mycoplana rhizolycopersici TaxID=2746702 RepID=A0ABX2QK06_9HYPH|nr:type 1 glutamine amidotransferase [Rhizobium rhizolycopersici]NVP56639.1 type 1 glutamine amidotransferase [Rhizobium rhizolycopersici]